MTMIEDSTLRVIRDQLVDETKSPLAPEVAARKAATIESYFAIENENLKLTAEVADLKDRNQNLDNTVKLQSAELHDVRERNARELASARAETERANSMAREAEAQRVYFETMFKAIDAIVENARPPAAMVNVRRPRQNGQPAIT